MLRWTRRTISTGKSNVAQIVRLIPRIAKANEENSPNSSKYASYAEPHSLTCKRRGACLPASVKPPSIPEHPCLSPSSLNSPMNSQDLVAPAHHDSLLSTSDPSSFATPRMVLSIPAASDLHDIRDPHTEPQAEFSVTAYEKVSVQASSPLRTMDLRRQKRSSSVDDGAGRISSLAPGLAVVAPPSLERCFQPKQQLALSGDATGIAPTQHAIPCTRRRHSVSGVQQQPVANPAEMSLLDVVSVLERREPLSEVAQGHLRNWVLDDREEIPEPIRRRILDAMLYRVQYSASPYTKKAPPPRRLNDNSSLTHLVEALFSVTLGPPKGTSVHPSILLWARDVAEKTFSPEVILSLRWSSFKMLAVAACTEVTTVPVLDALSTVMSGHRTRDWAVVTGLRAVENVLGAGPLASLDSIRQIEVECSSLWSMWTHQDTHRSPFVERAVVSTFLRIFRFVGSALGHRCVDRCTALSLFTDSRLRDPTAEKQVELLSVESLNYLKSVPDAPQDLPQLVHRWGLSEAQAKSVISKTLVHMSAGDPILAFFFFASALSARIVPNMESIERYTKALACSHVGYLLVQHLHGAVLPDRAIQRLLTAIFPSADFRTWPISDLRMLLRSVHCTPPFLPPTVEQRPGIERTLLVLVERGQASMAVSIVAKIEKSNPQLLQTSFLTKLLHRILTQRCYRVASRLLRFLTPSRSRDIGGWRRMVLSCYVRQGASSKLSRGLDQHQDQRRLIILSRLSGHRNRDTPSSIAILSARQFQRAVATASSQEAPQLYAFGVQVCAGARRIRAARVILKAAMQDIRTKGPIYTVMGNILVQAAFRPRRGSKNRRAVQYGLRALTALSGEFGISPDRVTINILVRAFAMWTRGADASFLRMLFDHFTRTGYPAGPHGVAPFRTKTTETTGGTALLRDMRGKIEFRRHVQPLYKTLIRGLRMRGDRFAAQVVKDALEWAKGMEAMQRGSWRPGAQG